MSAEVLRRAAALMRERAEAATPGDKWETDTKPYGHADDVTVAIHYKPHVFACAYAGTRENAEHIASWHPAVALAVADWLDRVAERDPRGLSVEAEPALVVARAYLGEQP